MTAVATLVYHRYPNLDAFKKRFIVTKYKSCRDEIFVTKQCNNETNAVGMKYWDLKCKMGTHRATKSQRKTGQ